VIIYTRLETVSIRIIKIIKKKASLKGNVIKLSSKKRDGIQLDFETAWGKPPCAVCFDASK